MPRVYRTWTAVHPAADLRFLPADRCGRTLWSDLSLRNINLQTFLQRQHTLLSFRCAFRTVFQQDNGFLLCLIAMAAELFASYNLCGFFRIKIRILKQAAVENVDQADSSMRSRIAFSPYFSQPILYASTIGPDSLFPPNWSTPFVIASRHRSASVISCTP